MSTKLDEHKLIISFGGAVLRFFTTGKVPSKPLFLLVQQSDEELTQIVAQIIELYPCDIESAMSAHRVIWNLYREADKDGRVCRPNPAEDIWEQASEFLIRNGYGPIVHSGEFSPHNLVLTALGGCRMPDIIWSNPESY